MIINKKRYDVISDIFEKYAMTVPFRLMINNKFFIEIAKDEFHKNIYKEVVCKYKNLPIKNAKLLRYYHSNAFMFYIESEELEEEILKVENNWYDSNWKYLTRKEANEGWF